ncbi:MULTISPECIES: nitroreductase family protein [Bacillaceae]|uniref:Nitroreductase family protein n=1 Tax=Evansella alkalicola TaxID=745819 RepID=A0ABS6JXM1_9BACI|nr:MULTISPECIES: nitroreductase family protein [Bacillaceae]MBU9723341.1 nitroreductase family protein [Bacillus alkalicola]
MGFEKSVIETMKKRKSIRTYDTKEITETDYKLINDFLSGKDNIFRPFGKTGDIQLVPVTNNVTDKGIKLGTYGFIKNPRAYLVGSTENNKYSLVEYGYAFHKVVLFLTELGIGTCWMGGTFNRKSFEQEIHLKDGQFIPCATPIGYEKGKQRIFDKTLRKVVKADNKKTWDKLFYNGGFAETLTKDEADHLEVPIEMVRIGPSASNKQPWRLVLSEDQNTCHFYIEHTPNYNKLGYNMQLLDMGIAMCQFDLASKEIGVEGKWEINDPKIELLNEHTEYIYSWNKVHG